MTRSEKELEGITLLGNQNTKYNYSYDPEILEVFDNRHIEDDYWVKFNCPEFTSLCPITGQPDFATIYINYIPNVKMVESKSLKLYLLSFRNHGGFHEDVVNVIMKDLTKIMEPRGNSCHVAAYPSILIVIMVMRMPSFKNSHGIACKNMIYIPWIKLIIDKRRLGVSQVFSLYIEIR